MVEFSVLQVLTGPGAEMFNYFFTIIMASGWICFGIGMLFKIMGRS